MKHRLMLVIAFLSMSILQTAHAREEFVFLYQAKPTSWEIDYVIMPGSTTPILDSITFFLPNNSPLNAYYNITTEVYGWGMNFTSAVVGAAGVDHQLTVFNRDINNGLAQGTESIFVPDRSFVLTIEGTASLMGYVVFLSADLATIEVSSIPEPNTGILMLVGALGIGFLASRNRILCN